VLNAVSTTNLQPCSLSIPCNLSNITSLVSRGEAHDPIASLVGLMRPRAIRDPAVTETLLEDAIVAQNSGGLMRRNVELLEWQNVVGGMVKYCRGDLADWFPCWPSSSTVRLKPSPANKMTRKTGATFTRRQSSGNHVLMLDTSRLHASCLRD
jgi:hypothetical protein